MKQIQVVPAPRKHIPQKHILTICVYLCPSVVPTPSSGHTETRPTEKRKHTPRKHTPQFLKNYYTFHPGSEQMSYHPFDPVTPFTLIPQLKFFLLIVQLMSCVNGYSIWRF